MSARILIVEDRDSLRRLMQRALEQDGHAVHTASTGTEGLLAVEHQRFDLVLTDLNLPGASGLEVVRASQRRQPRVPVVVLTGFGTVQTAVEAMKLGAADFLEKPVEIDDLSRLVHSLVESAEAGRTEDPRESSVFSVPGTPPIVGRHPAIQAAVRLLQKVAPTESTVLLTGESGTGKELFARALHALSGRAGGPYVAVNCAAIPEALVENELFGHEKGAFTGAARRQLGRFELARGGTLFLDEIGELTPAVQGKVLRVLEERTFERVGGGRSLHADVRLVAATNRDLQRMAELGEFRSDLFFRLDVFPIHLPPLRERAADVPLLAEHLLGALARRLKRSPVELDTEAATFLTAQPWPGNVRQLANVLERVLIVQEADCLVASDFTAFLASAGEIGSDDGVPGEREDEREAVRRALVEAGGDKAEAARLLGISLRSLQRKVQRHDLEGVPRYRS